MTYLFYSMEYYLYSVSPCQIERWLFDKLSPKNNLLVYYYQTMSSVVAMQMKSLHLHKHKWRIGGVNLGSV